MKLLFFAPLLALVAAENLQWCGDARYYPSQYTCFGTKLCPKQNGEVYLPCGAACYSTNMYYCDNGALKLWNPIQEPLLHCSGQPYYASKYTCFDNSFLCPRINGVATLRCGQDCYNPKQYSCTNGKLGAPFG